MKLREKTMSERTERGYYRSKEDHEELYWQIMEEYSRFITRPMLLQLNHKWSTQKKRGNEYVSCIISAKNKTLLRNKQFTHQGRDRRRFSGYWTR